MTKTLAQRQAEYRKRRPTAGDNGERRINTWVTTAAFLALDRLATRDGIRKRAVLENLILEADQKILSTLDLDSKEWDEYFNVTA